MLFHQNISSLRENFDNFIIYLNSLSILPDIIVFTEIWIHKCELNIFIIPGYNQFGNCNDSYRSGGVVVYVSDRLRARSACVDITSADALKVTVDLNTTAGAASLLIVALYRLHAQSLSTFLTDLDLVLSGSKERNVIVIGDMNLCLLKQSTLLDNYLSIMSSHGFDQLIDVPTRGNSCLDHIFSKSRDNFIFNAKVFSSGRSDHDALACEIIVENSSVNSSDTPPTNQRRVDFFHLKGILGSADWSVVYQENDPNIAFDKFLYILKNKIEESTNNLVYHNKLKILKPWMTAALCKRQAFRNLLYKKSKARSNDRRFLRFFQNFSKKLKDDIKRQKSDYYFRMFNCYTKDVKKQWGVINGVLGNSKKKNNIDAVLSTSNSDELLCNNLDIANEFNNFFASVVTNILSTSESSDGLDNVEYNSHFQSRTVPRSFFLFPTCPEEVEWIVYSLANNKAPGIDGISSHLVKEVKSLISPILSYIFNLSFQTGIFPDALKTALVVPLHKKGCYKVLDNYRPISLLSVFSKIIEKIVKKRLVSFFNINNIISAKQFGFMEGKSTEDALLNFSTALFDGLNRNCYVSGLFIDITKAFDSVDHDILFDRLRIVGIRGVPLLWFKSYLSGRTQCVKVNGSLSSTLPIVHGVPQGSVLGPLLFLVFINGLCNGDFQGSLTCFADDTALCFTSDNSLELAQSIQRDLDKLKYWFTVNKMVLSTKTKYINFSLRNRNFSSCEFFFRCKTCLTLGDSFCEDCIKIEQVHSIKYLGLILDERVNWKEHIAKMKGYLYAALRKFYFLKYICPRPILKTIYFSIIDSKLRYGISCWGGTYLSTVNPVLICQNKILRVMFGAARRDSVLPIYRYFKILPLRYLYIFRVLRIFYMRGGHIRANFNVYSNRLQNLNRVSLPLPKIESFRHFYTYRAPKLFNSLPLSISSSSRMSKFVSSLRAWLFTQENVEVLLF